MLQFNVVLIQIARFLKFVLVGKKLLMYLHLTRVGVYFPAKGNDQHIQIWLGISGAQLDAV